MPFTVEYSSPAHRARDTVALLRKETPDFIPPDLCHCGHRIHPTYIQLTIVFGVFCRRKCTELDSWTSMNWSANFFGNGQNWIKKSLHQRSGSGIAVLGPVRPLMADTLSKPTEHIWLRVEQIIVPYLAWYCWIVSAKCLKLSNFIAIIFAR